jgi:CheY-like chemotaxis protein
MWDFSPADATLDALIAVEVQKALIAETQEVLKELADARDAAEASSAATRDYYAGLVRALWSPDEGRERIDRFVEVLSAAGPTAVVEDVVRDSTDLLYAILDDGEPAFVRSTVGSAAAMDPLQVVAEICAGSMAAFERVGVELQLDLDAPTGQLCFGSAEALRRVIERMLGYARDRSGSGWVKLHAVCIPDGPNHRLRVACMDTGGLPGQDDDAGGDAARAAGGRFTLLTLESVGVKSEFQITYPALPTGIRGEADWSRASGDVGAVAPGPDVRAAANVLVVSSDVVDRRLVEAVLAPPHVNLVVVPDGDAAVALWREREFDLALVDLRGAGHDGLSTAQHLRDAEARLLRPRVPIVIMSHQVILDHLDADATQHVDAFMAKPISPAELSSILSRLAGRRI